jgi:hypothetical protein
MKKRGDDGLWDQIANHKKLGQASSILENLELFSKSHPSYNIAFPTT